MTIAWIGSSLSISLLLAGLAVLLETLLLRWDRPTRGVWAFLLFLSATLPLAFLGWQTAVRDVWAGTNLWVSGETGIPIFGLQQSLSRVHFLAGLVLPDLTTFLQWMWAITACAVVLWLGYSWWDLASRREHWTRGTFEGLDCYFSQETGPGLAGMVRSHLVVPEWIRELDREKRVVVAVHESEHQRRRDPWLMTFGYASLLLAPWNPILWWQRRRLRLAMEMDCDRRAVRQTGDPGTYAEALLDIAEQKTRWITAFSQSESHLLQRIRRLKGRLRPTGPGALGAGLAGGAVLVLMWAAPLPVPSPPRPDTVQSVNEVLHAPSPYTEMPRCLNCASLGVPGAAGGGGEGDRDADPDPLRVPIYIDPSGEVLDAVCRPLCSEAAEERLSSRLRQRRYSPARVWGVAVPAWFPVTVPSPEDSE